MDSREATRFGTRMVAVGRGKTQQRANLVKREAELPCPADEPQSRDIVGTVAAKPAALAMRLRQ